jgi:T5orf172 domain
MKLATGLHNCVARFLFETSLLEGVALMIDDMETVLPEPEPELQIVYVLTNPCMPGIIKIGRTGNLEMRVATLSSATSVPEPFEVAYAAYVEDAPFVERAIHAAFSLHRMPGREFFRLPVANAIAALSLAEVSQVSLAAEDDQPTQIVAEVRERAVRKHSATPDVFTALKSAGRPLSNRELAELMGVCDGEASKRVKALEEQLEISRDGKFRRIALKA